MEGEQFSLCWNNFHSNLSSGFNSLLKDEDLVDVTLAAGGKFMKAHKTVLSVCSPFFKDLFRANPSKHPIVILPDVNYGALSSLLQFMYQGEVSVSQEEIPTFMRVAEMLKVKGLTDNSSPPSPTQDTNGYGSGASRSPYNNLSDQRQLMKRPRPARKLIKPMPTTRPAAVATDSPKIRSPPPTVAKRAHIDEAGASPREYAEPLIKPKQEPVDEERVELPNVSTYDRMSQSFDDTSRMDVTAMLDTSLGEPSTWQPTEFIKPSDSNSPGTLQCILGKRGNPRLIVDGHSFFKKSVYKGKAFWYCKLNRSPEKCPAVCWTLNGNIVKWPHMHTHAVVPDIFNPDEDTEVPIENLQEVLWQTSIS